MRDDQLRTSKQIHRQTGKTFYLATRLFPEQYRHPTYVLYAFFRKADEVVDAEETAPPVDQVAQLERFRAAALGHRDAGDPVMAAFREVKARYGIPDAEVNAFVDAMLVDVWKRRYETYDELADYMRGSAAAVGAMMTYVLEPPDVDAALPAARALGEAFQLTNFLRDVREDVVERDRVYLPAETLERHGASHEQVADLAYSEGVGAAVADELARAERLYAEGVAGIHLLPADAQFPVLLAAVLYADHHRLVRALDHDVVSTTPELSTLRKLSLVARTRWHWQWSKDPEAVFRRVSALGDGDRERPGAGHHGPLPTD